jgi:hypothetical protein
MGIVTNESLTPSSEEHLMTEENVYVVKKKKVKDLNPVYVIYLSYVVLIFVLMNTQSSCLDW